MRSLLLKSRLSLWLFIPLALSPLSYAHAYLDPNTGSYVIQIAIGLIFGTFYAGKNFIARLITRLKEGIRKAKEKRRK